MAKHYGVALSASNCFCISSIVFSLSVLTITSGSGCGVGPVDAALNAIQKITGKVSELKITDYGAQNIPNETSNGSVDEKTNSLDIEQDDEEPVQRELYEYLGWILEWTVGAQSEAL